MTKPRDLATLGGGFTNSGTGAIQRTVENKLKDTVSVKDFGIGSGITDDTTEIQTLLNEVSAGGGGEIIFDSDNNYLVSDTITIPGNLTLRFTGAGFITLTQTTSLGGVFIILGTDSVPVENIVIYNPKVDAASYGHPTSATSGENGFGGTNCKNVQVFGGTIKNCRRGTSSPVSSGGKGVQFENGVENILVDGTTILNCTTAVEIGGAPDAVGPVQFRRYRNVQYRNLRVFDCNRVISVIQSFSPPDTTPEVGLVQISDILAYNCGRESVAGTEKNFGAVVIDRASNVTIKNLFLANTSTYGDLGAVVRQARGTNCSVEVEFLGNADALVLHDVGSTGYGTTGTCEDNTYRVFHKGTAGYAISGASGQTATLLENFYEMQLDTVSTGLVNTVVAFATLYCRFFSESKSTSIEGLAQRIIDSTLFNNTFPTQQFGIAATANINGIFFSFGSGTKIIGTEGANLLRLQHNSSNQRIDISTNGVALFGLGTYADNAAAIAAGLAVGQLYRTATGSVLIRY